MSHEFRMDDDGALDEFVADDANVHLERMSKRGWYLGIEVDGKVVQFWFHLQRKHCVPYYEVSDQ